MTKKLILISIFTLFIISCGANEKSVDISEEIPTSLIQKPNNEYNVQDFISVGWKKNKELDNSNFQSTIGIWYGFFNRRDAEVWIYDTHQNAINFGKKYAEEVINKRPSQIDPTNPTQIRYHAYIISGNAMILCEDNLEDCIELINLVDE